MRAKKHWYIVVQYTTVFGDTKETEIPCANKNSVQKTIKELHFRYKCDSIIADFKIIPIYR